MSDPTELFLGNAGTAMRPLTAVVCAGKGEFVMDGTPRMRERPIIDLVDGLKQASLNIPETRERAMTDGRQHCAESGQPTLAPSRAYARSFATK